MKNFLKNSEDLVLTLFALTWAIMTLFHYQAFHKWDQGYCVWIAALWLIFKPSSLYRFLTLIVFQVIQELTILPEKHNHWLLVTIVNLTILTTFVIRAFKERTIHINKSKFFESFRPYVCLELIILYFFAVFHKLNWDYFTLDVSCGAFFYKSQATRFVFLPESWVMEMLCMYATLFCEILIPTLLISSKWRKWGILAAVLFHGIIGFNPTSEFWNFSSVIYALLVLFAPIDLSKQWATIKWPLGRTYVKIGLVVVVAASIFVNNKLFEVSLGLVLWSLYMALALSLIAKTMKEGLPIEESKPLLKFNSPLLFFFPLLLFFNGLSPYLGLKTESSFAMFSNLRTEGSRSNHLLIGDKWQIFDFQKDLVAIKSSSDPYLNSLKDKKLMLPYYEFRKYAQEHPVIQAIYSRNGVIYDLKKVRSTSEFHALPAWFYKIFLVFRPVSMEARMSCSR